MLIHNNFVNMLFLLRLVFRWLRTLPQTTLHKNAYYKGVVHKAMKTILLIIFFCDSSEKSGPAFHRWTSFCFFWGIFLKVKNMIYKAYRFLLLAMLLKEYIKNEI